MCVQMRIASLQLDLGEQDIVNLVLDPYKSTIIKEPK